MKRNLGNALNIILSALVLFSFSGCGDEGNVSLTTETSYISEESIVGEDVTKPLEDYFNVEQVMQLYTGYLKKVLADNDAVKDARYTLAYVNADSIPELIYMEGDSHSSGVHVCVCDTDGNVFDVGEFGEYGDFWYVPFEGKIMSFYMGKGIYFTDFYRLNNLSIHDEKYFEIDDPVYEQDSKRYYVDGDEVSEDIYNEEYALMKIDDFVHLSIFDSFSYESTDDVLRVLTEYASSGKKPSVINISTMAPEMVGTWNATGIHVSDIAQYASIETKNVKSRLTVSERGIITLNIVYGETDNTDQEMAIIGYEQGVGGEKHFRCVSENKNREYSLTLNEDNSIEIHIYDYEEIFDNSSFYLKYERSTEEQ